VLLATPRELAPPRPTWPILPEGVCGSRLGLVGESGAVAVFEHLNATIARELAQLDEV
jgi:hypothetical protein